MVTFCYGADLLRKRDASFRLKRAVGRRDVSCRRSAAERRKERIALQSGYRLKRAVGRADTSLFRPGAVGKTVKEVSVTA